MSQTLDLIQLPLNGRVLIEASAGTGKTYSLSALYVRFILGLGTTVSSNNPLHSGHLTPKDILVLTFTNAATEELRNRIRQRLEHTAKALADYDQATNKTDFIAAIDQEDGFIADLLTHLAALPAANWPALTRRCQQAARSMDQAAIHTIHGFCQKALKRFAFAAGQPFEQVLEPDANQLIIRAYQDYWRKFIQPLSAPLADALIEEKITDPSSLKTLVEQNKELEIDADAPVANSLPDEIWAAEQPIKAASQAKQAARAICENHHQEMLDWLHDQAEQRILQAGKYGFKKDGTDNSKPLSQFIEAGQVSKRLSQFTPDGFVYYKGKSGAIPPEQLAPCFAAIAEFVKVNADAQLPTESLIAHAAHWTAAEVERQLSTQAQITYDSMVTNLAKALDSQQSPLAETLAAQLRHAYPCTLIDEFQDTDANQYAIFKAMYHGQPDDSFAWLMIGDPKQAIYSFRGADIQTYLEAKKATTEHRTLDSNFRASAELIAATNELFAESPLNESDGGLFGSSDIPFAPVRYRDGQFPAIAATTPMTLYHLAVEDFPQDTIQPRSKKGAKAPAPVNFKKDNARSKLAEYAARYVQNLSQNDGYAPEDIAILVRDRTEADKAKEALQAIGIESVFLSNKTSIYTTDEAGDFLTLLQAVKEPQNGGLLRAALATQLLGYSLEQLAEFAPTEEATVEQELAWQAQIRIFQKLKADWQRHGVLAMTQRLVNQLKLTHRISAIHAERRFTNLFHLAELLQKAATTHPSLDAQLVFLENAISNPVNGSEENSEPIIRLENERNRVQILTLHASKGLQYPVVLLPFVSLGADPKKDIDIDEEMRLLYVGITRAEQLCYMGYAPTKSDTKSEERSPLKRLLFGLTDNAANIENLTLAGLAIERANPDINADANTAVSNRDALPPLLPKSELPQAQLCQPEWQMTSYSALTRNIKTGKPLAASSELELKDSDAASELTEIIEPAEATGIHALPRGSQFGTLVHDILEAACQQGFAQADMAGLVAQHCRHREDILTPQQQTELHAWLEQAVHHTPLPLGNIAPTLAACHNATAETEFYMQFSHVPLDELQQLAAQLLGQSAPAQGLNPRNGMIMGYIDLLFEHDGKYYVLDYKTNHLGDTDAAYSPQALTHAIADQRYDVQALVYQQALYRLLKNRLGAEQAKEALGGCAFYFLRGIQNASHGVRFIPPNFDIINQVEVLLSSTEEAA